jgi:hypothetical protein
MKIDFQGVGCVVVGWALTTKSKIADDMKMDRRALERMENFLTN